MSSIPVIRVVDDDASFRVAISRLLEAAGYSVCTYANAGDFLLSGLDDTSPGCILLDLQMPGPGGLEVQRALTARSDALPIIFLSGEGDIPASVCAMKAGALDFLTKPAGKETLLPAIENALTRDEKKRASRERLKFWSDKYHAMTEREQEVFTRVAAGKMNKEIADDLGIAERTVKAHRAGMMEKMQVDTVADLVRVADRLRAAGVLPDGTPGAS